MEKTHMLRDPNYEPENEIEEYFVTKAKELGFKTYKFSSSVNGVPDQLLVAKGHTMFVELKANDEETRRDQDIQIAEIRKAGGTVVVIDNKADVDRLFARILAKPKRKETIQTDDLSVDLIKNTPEKKTKVSKQVFQICTIGKDKK